MGNVSAQRLSVGRLDSEVPADLNQIHARLDHEFPSVRIDFVLAYANLTSGSILSIAQRFDVPNNYVFLTSITATAIDELARLGGARIVC